MTDEEVSLKQKISDLKNHWNLIPEKNRQVDINNFTLLTKGDSFRIIYMWQCHDISLDTYVVEYDNSYRLNVVKAEKDYRPLTNVSRYLCCYIVFEYDFPDFNIRPSSLATRLVNLFLRNQVRVNMAKPFNRRYVLDSIDKNNIVGRLGTILFELVSETRGVYIEAVNNKCLISFLEPIIVNTEYSVMLQIANELVIRNRTR